MILYNSLFFYFIRYSSISAANVTDYGIEALCGGVCKSIEQLYLLNTNVTQDGVKIALLNLSKLTILDHPDVVSVLYYMHGDRKCPLPKYSLHSLKLKTKKKGRLVLPIRYNIGTIELLACICPFLADVDLDVSVGIKDEELFGLQAVKNLKTLRMSSCFENSVTFRGGLAPLLKVRGFELTTLKIDSLQNIDVALLIQLCPNLQHFLQNNAT